MTLLSRIEKEIAELARSWASPQYYEGLNAALGIIREEFSRSMTKEEYAELAQSAWDNRPGTADSDVNVNPFRPDWYTAMILHKEFGKVAP